MCVLNKSQPRDAIPWLANGLQEAGGERCSLNRCANQKVRGITLAVKKSHGSMNTPVAVFKQKQTLRSAINRQARPCF